MNELGVPGFHCVFVRDSLPNKPKRTECGVLNLADSSGNGTHWVAWFKRNGKFRYPTANRIGKVSKTSDLVQHGEDSK